MSEALPAGITIASFSEGYRKFFEVVPAITDSLKRHNYRLRHEVYARELGWEPLRADGLETDRYDLQSVHCLMRAVATHTFVAGARLILTDPSCPDAPLPFELACGEALDRSVVDPARLDRTRIAEISRLAILGQYRRRPGEADKAFAINDDFGIAPRIRLPYLTLGLYLALIALARRKRIDTLFALSEPTLARSISHLGIDVIRIGKPVERRGERIPSMMNIERVVADMTPFVRPFFDTISDEVNRTMRVAG